jgi:hypothetical protein
MRTRDIKDNAHYPFGIVEIPSERLEQNVKTCFTIYKIVEHMGEDSMGYPIFYMYDKPFRDKELAQREIRNWLYIQNRVLEGVE